MRAVLTAGLPALLLLAACGQPDATDNTPSDPPEQSGGLPPETGGDGETASMPMERVPGVAEGVTGQTYEATVDLSGYYMPEEAVQAAGNIELDHIFVGADWEFAEYFAAPEDAFLPILVQFNDVSSETGTNELGQEYFLVSYSFRPTDFRVTDEVLVFSASHPDLGMIRFEGRFDTAAVAQMHQDMPGETSGALIGAVGIGTDRIEGVRFMAWMGD